MNNNLQQIKELRSITGAGLSTVKEALEKTNGDTDKAIAYLREKGMSKLAKRAEKSAENGFIAHYIHGDGNLGVLVEVNTETDFSARNEKFREFAHNLALHIAASKPEYIKKEDIPTELLAKEKELASKNIDKNKPANVIENIIEGKLKKFYEEYVLLEQKFVKDDSKTIQDLLNEIIVAIGEKIEIGRFTRFEISGSGQACGL